jgi:tetratricopeptide (TPR) repeat protein
LKALCYVWHHFALLQNETFGNAKSTRRSMNRFATLIILLSIALSSCQGTKYFTKIGAKQELAGLSTEAANSYYMALTKKRLNVDAQIGMKKNGQLVLNSMLNDFAKAKNFGTKKDAVYAYQRAEDYKAKIMGVGIELQLADFYDADYREVKSSYLSELYDAGTSLLSEGKFSEAESKFEEIKSLEPNYKDTQELDDIAYVEPFYLQAKQSFDHKRYREAYDNFSKVTARKPTYKDASDMQNQCLQKGMYTIAVLPFDNASGVQGIDAKAAAYTLEALGSINDPFIKIVDREHMQAILQEQKLQLSGVVDEATAARMGELVGAQAIITGTVLCYNQQVGQLKSMVRQGYESFQVQKLNATDGKYYPETQYKPTQFTEYYNANSCNMSFQYKLIDLSTGEIIKTEIVDKTNSDEVLYAKYNGNMNNLFPANANGPSFNRDDRSSTAVKNSNK